MAVLVGMLLFYDVHERNRFFFDSHECSNHLNIPSFHFTVTDGGGDEFSTLDASRNKSCPKVLTR